MIRNYNVLTLGFSSKIKKWSSNNVGSPPIIASQKGVVASSSLGVMQLIFLFALLLGLTSNSMFSQCLGSASYPNGQYPSSAFTPANTGAAESITTGG